jgi:hypothetical protein
MGKRTRITSQDATNCFGASTTNTAFDDGILAIQTGTELGIASTSSLEAVTVQSNTFALGTGTAGWIIMHLANLESCCA